MEDSTLYLFFLSTFIEMSTLFVFMCFSYLNRFFFFYWQPSPDWDNPLGWVMFVSIFCFVGTTLWLLIFSFGVDSLPSLVLQDAGFHFVAAVFYLSASVVLAYITIVYKTASIVDITLLKTYRLDISAVVMSHVATLLYFLHAIFSAIRWKRA
uniref:Myelin and lymphocyte protein n=1 Tax=Poecilia reticulata TaxID=8081 RepID=A0A3P9MZ57_POERE